MPKKEKLPSRARVSARKVFWPRKLEKMEAVRANYRQLAVKAQQQLAAKEVDHGTYDDVKRAYSAIEGFKYRVARTGKFKKIKKTTKMKQKGLVDVLKDAKKLEKMKDAEFDQHINDVKFISDMLDKIEGDVTPGTFKGKVNVKIQSYLDSLNEVKAGTKEKKDLKPDVTDLTKKVKGYRKGIKTAAKELASLEFKRQTYEGVEHFSNSIPFHKAMLAASTLNMKEMGELETKLADFTEKRKKGKLNVKQEKAEEAATKRFNELLQAAEENGYYVHAYSTPVKGKKYKGTIVTPKYINKWADKKMEAMDKYAGRNLLSTGLYAVLAGVTTAAAILHNKFVAMKETEAALRETEAAHQATDAQLRDGLNQYIQHTEDLGQQNAELQEALELAKEQSSGTAVTTEDPFLPPITTDPITTPVTEEIPFEPPTIPPGVPGTVASTAAILAAPLTLGVFPGLAIGGGIVGLRGIIKTLTRYGETAGEFRQKAMNDQRKILKELDEPKEAMKEAREKATVALWDDGAKNADFIFDRRMGLLTKFREGQLPELDSI